jgi:Flp pilus assembly protein TadD
MTIPGSAWRWLTQPISLRGLLRHLGEVLWGHNPVKRYRWTYAAVALLLGYSTYSFITYRVLGNGFVVLLPIVGTAFGYLWAILLADELLGLFPRHPRLGRLIGWLKWGSLGLMGGYGVLALGLWMNSVSSAPLVSLPARIVSLRTVDLGPVSYRAVTLEAVGGAPGRQTILGSAADQRTLYADQEVQVITRRGVLGFTRVLRVHQDMERYYLRMVEVAPNARVALERLVGIYAEDGEFTQAIAWDTTLRLRYPDEYETTLQLGKRLTDARRFADAVTVFRHAAAVSREYEVLYALGYALAWSGKRDEAVQTLREAIQVDPDDWRAYYSLGYVYVGLGRHSEARTTWTKVLELLPNFPEVEQYLRRLPTQRP